MRLVVNFCNSLAVCASHVEKPLAIAATIICGATIGRYAFIGAGAVVRGDAPDYALMLGAPARQQGWMSRHGHRLPKPDADGIMVCQESGGRYREVEPGVVRCLDWSEDTPLRVVG